MIPMDRKKRKETSSLAKMTCKMSQSKVKETMMMKKKKIYSARLTLMEMHRTTAMNNKTLVKIYLRKRKLGRERRITSATESISRAKI